MSEERGPEEVENEVAAEIPREGERVLAGVACGRVLSSLAAYLDGTLPADERAVVEAHVRECDRCARFGGVYAAVAGRVRRITSDGPVSPEVLQRLKERLELG